MKPFVLLSLLALSLFACQDAARCVETHSQGVSEANAPLRIGGTYGELLANVVGERSGIARWLETDTPVRGLPPPGDTGIIVTVHEPSTATEVDRERRGGGHERLACPDELQAEFEVEVRSDDGVLDASLLVPIVFHTPGGFETTVDVTEEDPEAVGLSPTEENARLQLTLSYRAGTAPSGTLRLQSPERSVDLMTWTLD